MVFTGRAVYDSGVFNGIAEDVSDIIGMISPDETPLLDVLGDAPRPAQNVYHEWLEDELSPNTIVSSSLVLPAGTALGVHVAGGAIAGYIQTGALLKNKRTGEYMQVAGTNTNSITVTRAFGGTSAATILAGDEVFVISDAALEGADVSVDTSRPRTRQNNYTQIFKKDVIVSGTVQAVNMLGNISDEFDYQRSKKVREAIRDLEKATIQGKLSGNSLGSSSAYRTMRGIWDFITTNSTSTATLSPDVLDTVIQGAWDQGATDLDVIVCDASWKRVIDAFNETRVEVTQESEFYKRRISLYEGTFGTHRVVLSRWMPATSLMVLSSERCHVVPLQGRSFTFEQVSRTGDSEKGMVLGEYTTEVMNEEGLAKAYGGGIA